ncbi:hypothetical protein [Variovorax sp. PMC12]|uniref:hypothetical protein n=1 Tax=Variovorax sp. PMC12 TaxID=2126319 RepID=UPI000D13D81A|nr:hypothetical protein [Variovorax sp. PMC12]AVQ83825.1 hypothetical protein C4F17_24315 [Variovorax sp. PMC12]
MASIVDTSVKNFNSTMSGAPALSGTAGSLIALLDAVLVNGFDIKAASALTVSGGIASMPFIGSHSAQVESVISITGITGAYASLNGEQKVTSVAAGVVRFATSLADGAASGTISFKMAPLGWLKPFAGTNLAAYKASDVAASGMLLRVDDTGTQSARVRGYESMSDINNGLGPFPNETQMAGGGYWAKSVAASSAAVPWAIHGDGRLFYFTAAPGVANTPAAQSGVTRVFGDMLPLRPGGDPYACYLCYSNATSSVNQIDAGVGSGGDVLRFAAPRDFTGLGSSVLHAKYPYTFSSAIAVSGLSGAFGPFPSIVDGSLMTSRQFLASNSGSAPPRADFPGVYHCGQTGVWDTFKFLDTAPAAGVLAGRTLQALPTSNSGLSTGSTNTNTGVLMVDRTGPWR